MKPAPARTKIAEAAKKPGTDFANLATTMSDAGTKDKGGDLGEVARGDLVADLDKAVFNAPQAPSSARSRRNRPGTS